MARSFDTFFRRHYGATLGQLMAKGASAEVAADCAQEAFVRAYARWPVIRHYREPAAWVNRVANNLLIDSHRRRHSDIAATTIHAHSGAGHSEAQIEAAVVAIDVRRAIDALPPQQKRATELHYLESRSTDEGAQALGISGGAFRFHLARARENLRVRLGSPDASEERP